MQRTGDGRLEAKIRRLYGIVLFWEPTPLEYVAQETVTALDWARARGMYSLEAGALSLLARVAAMQGDFTLARRRNEEAQKLIPDYGELLTLATDSISEGLVELLAGQLTAAERILRRAYDLLVRRGGASSQANVAAMLTRVLLDQGRDDDAEQLTRVCEEVAAAGQLDTQIKWRQYRAIALARHGRRAAAEVLARAAVKLAAASEQLDSEAEALADLAEVLRLRGKRSSAARLAKRALRLYEQKRNRIAAARVQALIDGLHPPASQAT